MKYLNLQFNIILNKLLLKMAKKKFLSIIHCYDTYNSLFKTGIIVSPNKYKNKYLYIIGINISYGNIDWLDYDKFIIIQLSEFEIISVYKNIFGEKQLKKKQEQKISVHNLLHEILLRVKCWERPYQLTKYFGIKEFKAYSTKEISKIVDFSDSNKFPEGYVHIDINTGLRFCGETTYDINGNILK